MPTRQVARSRDLTEARSTEYNLRNSALGQSVECPFRRKVVLVRLGQRNDSTPRPVANAEELAGKSRCAIEFE